MKKRLLNTKYLSFFARFSLVVIFVMLFSLGLYANNDVTSEDIQEIENEIETVEEKFNAGELIFDHILDSYDWHICTWKGKHISVYLPVIVFSEGELYAFSSKHFHHEQTLLHHRREVYVQLLRQLLLKNLTQLLERSPEYVYLTESK